jgi:hypothetical protein
MHIYVSLFFNSLSNRLRITNYCLRSVSSSLLKFTRFIQGGLCSHWRTFAINNLQWLLVLRPHDTFNSEKNSMTIKR